MAKLVDEVRTEDRIAIETGERGESRQRWADPGFGETLVEKNVIEVHGWVSLVLRERGKIVPGSHREGLEDWMDRATAYEQGKR